MLTGTSVHEPRPRALLRLGVVIPVDHSDLVLEKMREDYGAGALDAEARFYFADGAPPSIESPADVVAAEAGVAAAIGRARDDGVDVIVVGCFSEPGVEATAEPRAIPVIGEGRPTLAAVGGLFERFSIISASSASVGAKSALVEELGLTAQLVSILPLDLPVAELTADDPSRFVDLIGLAAEQGAKAVILGCTGLAPGLTASVRAALSPGISNRITVVDPAEVAGRVALALASSRRTRR